MAMNYLTYNREERDICAHLFRLLLDDQGSWRPLKTFLDTQDVCNPRIFCEVALVRDAYFARKPSTEAFMQELCEFIADQNSVSGYTRFSELPSDMQDSRQTHPKQIYYKLKETDQLGEQGDRKVYGSLQAMFNAKPDLVVCTGSDLIVYEAKYTSLFTGEQLERTQQIADAWASLLYTDLGYDAQPNVSVRTLGMAKASPDVSWEKVYAIASEHWGPDDFSVRALSKVMPQSMVT